MQVNSRGVGRALTVCRWGLAAALSASLAQGCKKPSSQSSAPSPVTTATVAQPPVAPPEPAGVTARITESWNSGLVAFGADHPVFTIARDYEQVLALPVRNLSDQTQRIVATLEPWDEGMIGDFGGDGGIRPLELPPGQTVSLPLDLYAQDAIYPSYRNTVTLADAGPWAVMARARSASDV